jgi:hypothetical protein
MKMSTNNETFSYTYSASQQEEVKRIREKYVSGDENQKENKMELLRRLDRNVERHGSVIALIMGVMSALLFGVGMTCTMVWTDFFVLGIIIGIIGMAGVSITYPLYTSMIKKGRAKLSPKIIEISNELMQ